MLTATMVAVPGPTCYAEMLQQHHHSLPHQQLQPQAAQLQTTNIAAVPQHMLPQHMLAQPAQDSDVACETPTVVPSSLEEDITAMPETCDASAGNQDGVEAVHQQQHMQPTHLPPQLIHHQGAQMPTPLSATMQLNHATMPMNHSTICSTTLTNSTSIPVVTSTIDMAATTPYHQPTLPPYCPDYYGRDYYHPQPPDYHPQPADYHPQPSDYHPQPADYHQAPPPPEYHQPPPGEYCGAAQHMCSGLHVPTGPATVRMVSTNSSPPIALPVQVPPGHVLQQIVDEHGTLQHVILSSQLPMCYHSGNSGQPGAHQFYGTTPHSGNTQGYIASYQPNPAQYSPVMTPPSMTQPSTPPLNYGKQERHLAGGRHFDKPRQKFYSRPQQQQQLSANHQMHSNYTHQAGRTPNNVCLLNTPPTSPKKDDAARGRDDERGEEGEDMPAPLAELLSHIPLIEVTNVTPFSAVVQWQPPLLPHFSPPQQYCPDGSHEQPAGGGRNNLGSDEMTVDAGVSYTAADVSYTAADVSYTAADITYEVFVNGHLVGSVTAATSYQLHDLKPGYEYKLQLLCCCAGIRATSLSREVIFVTPTTIPEQPSPPRLFNKSKNSLFVKWVPPKDGGARISSYTLQITEGSAEGEGLWRDAYCGRGRDFTVNNLTPATSYRLRIAAFNLNGPSDWSRELVCSTCGVPPAKPCPPTLLKATVSSLLLSWPRQSPNERYVLKMEDCQNTYGFLVVYRGPDNSYCCSQLRRSSSYNFRLGAESDEGSSPPSDVVCYCTLPEPPGAPSPPSVKGRRSHVLRFAWGPPADTGGAPILSYRLLLDSGNGFEVAYEGTSCECECRDLTPGKTYAAVAQAVSSGGEGHCSKPVMATTEPVVPQQCPSPALAAKPKANVLQLKWDPPAFDGGSIVTEYNVELQQPQGDARLVYSGVSLACTVAGLLPGRPYTLLVRAVNAVGPGPWSEPLQVVSGPAPPEAPRCPQLACRSPTVVCVSWDEPANNGACIEAYNVEVAEVSPSHPESSESSSTCGDSEPTDLTFTHATSSTTTSAEVKHLQPDTSYAMRVCALNAAGLGGFSPHSIVMTPPSAPSAPTHVTATVTCTSINLRWTEPKCNGDPILHYLIDLADAGRSIATAGPVVECTIPDCLPDTQYKLRVQAVNGVGIGPASATFKCHTSRLPPAPPALELLKASHNSLKVSWGEKKQSILKNDQLTYCLQMEFPNPQNQSLEFYQVYCGSGTSYRLTRLDEATPYRLRICASSEAGVGPNSEPVEFRTTWAPPVAPKAPRATERLEEGAVKYEVEWCPVRCHGGTPVTYVLQARIATKQLDYTTVYTGSDTRHVMDVCPGALYNVRVCAVRQLQGGQGTLPGAYSSPTVFNAPDAVQPTRPLSDNTHHRGSAGGRTKLSWQDLTDAQKAALLVTVFSLLAALLAYALAPALHT